MTVTLAPRTAETVRIYFREAQEPSIRRDLPQKAQTVEEALTDYQRTLLPGATSFGLTIQADGRYVGDIWCYCIDPQDTPNCMLSYCVFDRSCRNKSVATTAVQQFLPLLRQRYAVRTVGAFTFAHNAASIRVLEKCGFTRMESFTEDGQLSHYYEYTLPE